MAKKPLHQSEIQSKINKIREKLEQFQEMKDILKENGIPRDETDKQKESILIQRLMGFEKDLKRLQKSGPVAPPEKFSKAKLREQRPS